MQAVLPQPGDDLLLEHQLHLGGTPGRQATVARPIRIQMPGAVPTGFGKRLGPLGKERLDAVPLGHHAIAAGEHRGDRRERIGVFDQRHARATGRVPRASGHPGSAPGRRVITTRSARSHGGPEDRQMVFQHVAQRRVERRPRSPGPRARWLSHWLLVSSDWPLTSSLPIEMISARMDAFHLRVDAGRSLARHEFRIADRELLRGRIEET